MKPKCKPGDLAIVIKAYNAENIGTIVRIIKAHPKPYRVFAPQGDTIWATQAPRPMAYNYHGVIRRRCKGPIPDSQLQPIRGTQATKTAAKRRAKSLETV